MIGFGLCMEKEYRNKSAFDQNVAWICKSLLVSFLFIWLSVSIGMYWETNDDPSIAYLLSLRNNDFSPFQWQILSGILHFLFVHFPVINWWTVNTVFALWLSALTISYVIYKRYPARYADALVGIVLVALWVTAGHCLNFTRTAAAVAVGGCLLIADSILTEKDSPVQYGIGCVLLLYGAAIRSYAALITLGFLAVTGGVWLLFDGFSFRKSWFRMHLRPILGLCLAAILFFGGWAVDSLTLSPQEKAYNDFNAVRSEVQDYPNAFPSYESAKDVYDSVGIDAQVRESLLFKWFSEDTDVITTEALEHLSALKTEDPSFSEWYIRVYEHESLLLIGILICILLLFRDKWNILRIGIPAVFAVVCSLLLSWNGRIPARVFASVFFAMIGTVVFLAGEPCAIVKRENKNFDWRWLQKIKPMCSKLLVIAFFIGFFASLWMTKDYVDIASDNGQKPWTSNAGAAEHRSKSLDLIHNSKEYLYIFDLTANPYSVSDAYGMWERMGVGYCDNLFLLGGWDARHPDNMDRLAQWGITNPVKALIENPRVRSVYSADLLRYLRNVYEPRTTVSEVGMYGSTFFVQYCAPVADSKIDVSSSQTAKITEIRQCSGDQSDIWYFAAQVENNGETVRDFYCNITLNGARYTYRLAYNAGMACAYFYEIGEEFDLAQADVCIFERMPDGSYMGYEIP